MISFLACSLRNGGFNGGMLLLLLLVVSCHQLSRDALYSSDVFSVYADSVVQQPYKAVIWSATEIHSSYRSPLSQKVDSQVRLWKCSADLSDYPRYQSDQHIVDALYNMSLEEMIKDIRPDSTFMAGAKWNGVWTRDISYSIALSLGLLEPGLAKNSLMKKVKNKRIIQDTGTGGSWPVSTDRTTWALAAWEVFKVTGDMDWLARAYEIIRNSTADDQMVASDKTTGMMYGESSFLDWREQSYPKWMGPVDIFETRNLGTNAVHYRTYRILAEMALILGHPAEEYTEIAERIKTGINTYLWLNDKGYYAQFLYGNNSDMPSPRSEALGEALSVLYDIADTVRQKRIIASVPVTTFGIPCIFPQIPDIQPYHNNAVWPFVEAFWTLASAKAGNETAVLHGLASIYRQAALFLTNKENLVAETGDFMGTAINSDRQLWSVAGNMAIVFRLFLGMDLQPDGIVFRPFIPEAYRGKKTMTNLHYRNMVIDITVTGYGKDIRSFSIDGKASPRPFLPASLSGHHTIVIEMNKRMTEPGQINMQPMEFVPFPETYPVKEPRSVTDSSVSEVSPPPVYIIEAENTAPLSERPCKGFSGKGCIEISKEKNRTVLFTADVDETGDYAIDFRYSNGSGPVNTDNKCALRTLKKESKVIGVVIFPQLGKDEWSNWGISNVITTRLNRGISHFTLSFEPYDENMNGEINTALLDFMRLTKVP